MEARWKECARVVDDMIANTALNALDVEKLAHKIEPVVFIACLVSLKDRRNAMTYLQLTDHITAKSTALQAMPVAILDLLSMIYSKGYIVPPCMFIDVEALELVVKRIESEPHRVASSPLRSHVPSSGTPPCRGGRRRASSSPPSQSGRDQAPGARTRTATGNEDTKDRDTTTPTCRRLLPICP